LITVALSDLLVDHLIIAGDIGQVFHQTSYRGLNKIHHSEFIKYCAKRWQHIFLVIGNHEAWGKSMIETRQKVKTIADNYPNVHYMENTTVELPELGIYIAGCKNRFHVCISHHYQNRYLVVKYKPSNLSGNGGGSDNQTNQKQN
jgi:hypothetical protein